MAYESYCAACTYMSENDNYGKYWCERKGEYRLACDAKCYNFCEAYSRSNYSRENMYENSRSHSSSGCYLTTAMCIILGYPDNNYYLKTLRQFRDNVLKTNPKYWPLLVTYDSIGPEIAFNLLKDKNQKEIAQTLFTKYISPSVTAIKEEKTTNAINTYVAMTNALAERYNITFAITDVKPEDVDLENLGHARKRVPTNKKFV